MPRQIVDGIARKGGSLLVWKRRVGQSGMHIHDTLLKAHSARFDPFWKKSGGVVGKPQPRELPALVRIEEVAVGRAAVSGGRRKRRPAQDQLVDHELAVVFAERASVRAIARIDRIGAAGALPAAAEGIVEVITARGDLPLHFGG